MFRTYSSYSIVEHSSLNHLYKKEPKSAHSSREKIGNQSPKPSHTQEEP